MILFTFVGQLKHIIAPLKQRETENWGRTSSDHFPVFTVFIYRAMILNEEVLATLCSNTTSPVDLLIHASLVNMNAYSVCARAALKRNSGCSENELTFVFFFSLLDSTCFRLLVSIPELKPDVLNAALCFAAQHLIHCRLRSLQELRKGRGGVHI